MKVRLTAFNGLLKSKIMDWPENLPGTDCKMLALPLRKVVMFGGSEWQRDPTGLRPSELTFREAWCGEVDPESGMPIYEFELISVHPDYWYRDGQDDNLEEKKS